LTLGIAGFFLNSQQLVNPLWVFSAYLLITIGELFLSPIGLSAVTELSPPNLVGVMMGVWFVATGFGGVFAGYLAQLADIPQAIELNTQKLAIYQHAFFSYAWIAFLVAFILFLIDLKFRKAFI